MSIDELINILDSRLTPSDSYDPYRKEIINIIIKVSADETQENI